MAGAPGTTRRMARLTEPRWRYTLTAEAAEAGDAVGQVGLAGRLELGGLDRRQQLGGERLDLVGAERLERGALELAVAAQARRRADLHEQVRAALFEQVLQ